MLAKVFDSIAAQTARKDKVSMWVYVDEDDQVTRRAIDGGELNHAGIEVHWHYGGQTSSFGEMQLILWRLVRGQSEAYMIMADDICFGTFGWDECIRTAAAQFPDGIFLGSPHDPMTADTCTYPVFGARWLETMEQIFPNHFPFWYVDRWVHQIGEMAGRFVWLPFVVPSIGGKGLTRRMRDLPFWARFFQLTLDERIVSAKKLIDAMNLDPEKTAAAMDNLRQCATELEKQQDKFSDLYTVFQEERFTQHTPEERRAFNPVYFQKEAAAVAQMLRRAQQRIADKQFEEALKFIDATLMSNLRVRQAQDMKVVCLRALGKNSEADKVASEVLVAWPEMNFFRRLFRFLGMVASDGKAMVIGFLFKNGKKK